MQPQRQGEPAARSPPAVPEGATAGMADGRRSGLSDERERPRARKKHQNTSPFMFSSVAFTEFSYEEQVTHAEMSAAAPLQQQPVKEAGGSDDAYCNT